MEPIDIVNNMNKLPLLCDLVNENRDINLDFRLFFSPFFDIKLISIQDHIEIWDMDLEFEIIAYDNLKYNSIIPYEVTMAQLLDQNFAINKKDIIYEIHGSSNTSSIETKSLKNISIDFLKKFIIPINLEMFNNKENLNPNNVDIFEHWEEIILEDIYSRVEQSARITLPDPYMIIKARQFISYKI